MDELDRELGDVQLTAVSERRVVQTIVIELERAAGKLPGMFG